MPYQSQGHGNYCLQCAKEEEQDTHTTCDGVLRGIPRWEVASPQQRPDICYFSGMVYKRRYFQTNHLCFVGKNIVTLSSYAWSKYPQGVPTQSTWKIIWIFFKMFVTLLFNLWWLSNSVCMGFGTAMRMGPARRFKQFPTTYTWVSSQLPFTKDFDKPG